ncbi:MAG: RNA 2',3'-cyclic phosphodiesterase [Chloroflexi bacterium]|nr:RNA 2',3'-cyclic phosphodiesterase [Chloroflexota bacterium]
MKQQQRRTEKGLRLFVAVGLPEETRAYLRQAIQELRSIDLDAIRWVKPEGIHLTLKFLGDTPVKRLDAIGEAMFQGSRSFAPFGLRIRGAGAFPNLSSPRVVWLGLSGEVTELARLQGRLEDALEAAGFPREQRGFSPHLTLGRVNGRLSAVQVQTLTAGLRHVDGMAFPDIPVTGISLMESNLDGTGARYVERKKVGLG